MNGIDRNNRGLWREEGHMIEDGHEHCHALQFVCIEHDDVGKA